MTERLTGEPVTRVVEDVFAVSAPFWGYPLNLYFVAGPEWTVVDTGIATTPAEAIVPFMGNRSGVEALTLVLGTHGHVDHIGGNGALKALNERVRFTLHEADIGWAESVQRHYLQLYKSAAPGVWDPDDAFESAIVAGLGETTAVDVPLSHGQTIELPGGRTIEVHHVGAHSPGHVVFVDRASDVAFVGDILQGRGSVNNESGLRAFPLYTPVPTYRRALETVRHLRVPVVCTAHEGVAGGEEIEREIESSLRFSRELDEVVLDVVSRKGRVGLAQLVDAILERWPGYERSLQIHVTTAAHLDDLARTGHITGSIEAGVKTWSSGSA